MSFMNKHCDEIRELLAAYSMGATDPEETALVERHLPDCPEAVAELAEYLALNDAMLYLPELKQTSAIESAGSTHATGQQTISTPATRRDSTATKPSLVEKLATQSTAAVSPPPNIRRPNFTWVYRLVGAAAILTLLATNALWAQRVQQLNEELAVVAAITPEVVEVVETVEVVVTQEVIITPEASQFILGEQTQHRVVAADIEGHGDVSAVFVWDEETQAGAFYVTGLEHSSQDRLYQLWLIRDDDAVNVGRVVVGEEELGVLLFQVDTLIDDYSTFLLTIEPENDASQRNPVIGGQL